MNMDNEPLLPLKDAIVESNLLLQRHIAKKLINYDQNNLSKEYINKNKIKIGAIHSVNENGINCIQCSLLGKNYKNVSDVTIGICDKFVKRENNKKNRILLNNHKMRYHFDKNSGNLSKLILLKVKSSLQSQLKKKKSL